MCVSLQMSSTGQPHIRALLLLTLISAYVIVALVITTGIPLDVQPEHLSNPKELQETIAPARNYTISIWRVGQRMKRRFLRSFGPVEKDPFALCSVRNCRLEVNDSLVQDSDAVMFHLHLLTDLKNNLPRTRSVNQRWIFFTDESPYHTFLSDRTLTMKDLNGIFNLSMTYRSDSDIPVPYGRTERLPFPNSEDFSSILNNKTKGITILGSNCGGKNDRWRYVHALRKHIEVDIFGGCGKKACPGHFTKDCDVIKDYQFYLAFENSNCAEYMTEKLWYNAYYKKAIPIVMGPSKEDYTRLCPPYSFIHVEDFSSPKELADYIRKLQASPSDFLAYHAWRRNFRVLNEHGYFGSPSLHLCRMCEMLNRPIKEQTLQNLESWWSVQRDCRGSPFNL
ncbi:glycoprotein 3-alpha-L-fucosyltransferase A-like [Tropilaelaps mercedesae]|uniref:Fucosyltransferase n=1 Tax=Tropilaelaps mercedesae TaxID=418985 RepID=A0A1V9XMQ8_9ACAR|nr:glycoprotein 3-alpha-L-fucosyltransferase A-like [Tropilaelaps mercedesae]